MSTVTIANLSATLNNLNMVGSITWNSTKDTAIPPSTVGLYQLIDKNISELLKLKSSIKTNEKKLIEKFKADSTDPISLDGNASSNHARQESSTTTGSVGNQRGGLTTIASGNKPAVITSGTSARNLSEDAVFDLLGGITHLIMQINNDDSIGNGAIGASITTN